MKKLMTIALLLFSMAVMGETGDFIPLPNGFSMSASMDAFLDTPNAEDVREADRGAKWHLEVSDDTVIFWIDVPPLGLYNLSKKEWNLSETMAVTRDIDGLRGYLVFDRNFIHLQIVEYSKNLWSVHLCSVPMPKE